jgi:hypothetical protein
MYTLLKRKLFIESTTRFAVTVLHSDQGGRSLCSAIARKIRLIVGEQTVMRTTSFAAQRPMTPLAMQHSVPIQK